MHDVNTLNRTPGWIEPTLENGCSCHVHAEYYCFIYSSRSSYQYNHALVISSFIRHPRVYYLLGPSSCDIPRTIRHNHVISTQPPHGMSWSKSTRIGIVMTIYSPCTYSTNYENAIDTRYMNMDGEREHPWIKGMSGIGAKTLSTWVWSGPGHTDLLFLVLFVSNLIFWLDSEWMRYRVMADRGFLIKSVRLGHGLAKLGSQKERERERERERDFASLHPASVDLLNKLFFGEGFKNLWWMACWLDFKIGLDKRPFPCTTIWVPGWLEEMEWKAIIPCVPVVMLNLRYVPRY